MCWAVAAGMDWGHTEGFLWAGWGCGSAEEQNLQHTTATESGFRKAHSVSLGVFNGEKNLKIKKKEIREKKEKEPAGEEGFPWLWKVQAAQIPSCHGIPPWILSAPSSQSVVRAEASPAAPQGFQREALTPLRLMAPWLWLAYGLMVYNDGMLVTFSHFP